MIDRQHNILLLLVSFQAFNFQSMTLKFRSLNMLGMCFKCVMIAQPISNLTCLMNTILPSI